MIRLAAFQLADDPARAAVLVARSWRICSWMRRTQSSLCSDHRFPGHQATVSWQNLHVCTLLLVGGAPYAVARFGDVGRLRPAVVPRFVAVFVAAPPPGSAPVPLGVPSSGIPVVLQPVVERPSSMRRGLCRFFAHCILCSDHCFSGRHGTITRQRLHHLWLSSVWGRKNWVSCPDRGRFAPPLSRGTGASSSMFVGEPLRLELFTARWAGSTAVAVLGSVCYSALLLAFHREVEAILDAWDRGAMPCGVAPRGRLCHQLTAHHAATFATLDEGWPHVLGSGIKVEVLAERLVLVRQVELVARVWWPTVPPRGE